MPNTSLLQPKIRYQCVENLKWGVGIKSTKECMFSYVRKGVHSIFC